MTDVDGKFSLDVPAGAILCRTIQDMVIEKSGFKENAKFFNEKAKRIHKHVGNFAINNAFFEKNTITFNY